MSASYQEIVVDTRRALEQAGVSSAGLEARLLVASAAGKSPDELLRDLRMYPSAERLDAVAEYLRRRLSGEPLAYIIGEWGFMGRIFEVTRDTLIRIPSSSARPRSRRFRGTASSLTSAAAAGASDSPRSRSGGT